MKNRDCLASGQNDGFNSQNSPINSSAKPLGETMRALSTAVAIACFATFAGNLSAQNVIHDYAPHKQHIYSPQDPWKVGVVFRNHMGHGGLFYNCDHQEDKRCSPYIYWRKKPKQCHTYWHLGQVVAQQICEVKQRIRWGSSSGTQHISPLGPVPYLADQGAAVGQAPVVLRSNAPVRRNDGIGNSRAELSFDSSFRMTKKIEAEEVKR